MGRSPLRARGTPPTARAFWGLAGLSPETFDPARAEAVLAGIAAHRVLPDTAIAFDPATDLIFDYDTPSNGHANAMQITARDGAGATVLSEVYYSIGGGFILTAAEFEAAKAQDASARSNVPYPFQSSREMLDMAQTSGLSIAQMKRANELTQRTSEDLDAGIARIWQVMNGCLTRGLTAGGILPGGLSVKRRARGIFNSLQEQQHSNLAPPHIVNDWISAYAMAVNEENAAGGQVVTAPTNGAAGRDPRMHPLLARSRADGRSGGVAGFPFDRGRNRRVDQTQCVNFGGGMRVSGRGGIGLGDGGRGHVCRSGRHSPRRWKMPLKSRLSITLV